MRQLVRRYPSREGRAAKPLAYLLHLPPGAAPAEGWPLVLFLHGSGERGADLSLLLRHGLPRLVEEGSDFPFLIASPQCPERMVWHRRLPSLEGLIDELCERERVDRDRVYLTGLSMGGFGCWHLAARCPERFAAVVPICGGGLASHGFPARVRALRELALWAFHGERDDVVPVAETTRLVEALRACGGRATMTIYPETGHDSWTRTYANPELYRWLLAQRRGSPVTSRPDDPR